MINFLWGGWRHWCVNTAVNLSANH